MERRLLLTAVLLAWLALPLTALNFSRAWDHLPQRIAVHFDANWQPNGWTSREGARTLALGTTGFLLLVFTIAAFAVSRSRTSNLSRWMVVVVFYVALGLIYSVNKWIVDRNLTPQQSLSSAVSLTSSDEPDANLHHSIFCSRTL
jgi:Protein of unknown function (DUF1648)